MSVVYYKQGDTWPSLKARLLDANGLAVENLDVASVSLTLMRSDQTSGRSISATVTSAATAEVEVQWSEGDLSLPGIYYGEFKVVWEDGSVAHVPNSDRIEIVVTATMPEPS